MTIEKWLAGAAHKLSGAGLSTARLDTLILLEDATGKDRGWLLAHPEYEPSDQDIKNLDEKIKRRSLHEPLAYIRGKSEFYGREFKVTPATLQPRPETETMLELFFKRVESRKLDVKSIVDVGTGSGAIAITAKLEMPELEVFATEINEDALKVAKENASSLNADAEFYQGNLLEPLKNKDSDINSLAILANLPYVSDSHTINEAAMHEPKVAIFSGEDGLDLYREMFAQLSTISYKLPSIFTESLPFQHEDLAKIAASAGYKLIETEDFIQVFIKETT